MNNPLAGTDPTGYSCSGTRIGSGNGSICGGENRAQQNAQLPTKTSKGNGAKNSQGTKSKPTQQKPADIGGQEETTSGQKAEQKTPSLPEGSNTECSVKNECQSEKPSSNDEFNSSDFDYGGVGAEYRDIQTDENGDVTKATVFCDRVCQLRAGDAYRITANDISLSIMMISIRRSQKQVATGFYRAGEYASFVFLGVEVMAAAAVRWALLTASEKVAWYSLTGEFATITNGATIPQLGPAWHLGGAAGWILPRSRATKPLNKGVVGGKPRVKIDKNGKYKVEVQP